jgi:hypothetical protein
MNYFFLFCICFLPLLLSRWTRVSDLPSKPEVVAPAPAKEVKPPSPSAVARVVALLRKPKTKPETPPPPSFFQQPLQTILASGKLPSASSSWFAPPGKKGKERPSAESKPRATPTPTPTPLPPSLPPAPFRRPPVPTSHHYAVARADADEVVTMTAFLGTEGSNVDVDLVVLMTHLQAACKHIASILASPTELQTTLSRPDLLFGVGRDAPKPLAVVSVSAVSSLMIKSIS